MQPLALTPELDRTRKGRAARRDSAQARLTHLSGKVSLIELLDRGNRHYRITTRCGWVVDFWPGTEKWREPGRFAAVGGQGFDALVAEIDARNRRSAA